MSGLADTDVNASKPSTASAHEPHCAPHALPAKPRSSARESAAADGSAKPSRIAIADALLRSSHASQQVWSGLVWSRCGAVALWALSTGRRSSVCTAAHQRKSATWWLTARRVLTAVCTQPHWNFHEGIGFAGIAPLQLARAERAALERGVSSDGSDRSVLRLRPTHTELIDEMLSTAELEQLGLDDPTLDAAREMPCNSTTSIITTSMQHATCRTPRRVRRCSATPADAVRYKPIVQPTVFGFGCCLEP